MKYIKNYEELKKHIHKFKIGDAVKINGDNTNTIYVIDGYDYDKTSNIKNICRLKKYVDKNNLANKEGFYSWVIEFELIKAEQYEIDALKYNL